MYTRLQANIVCSLAGLGMSAQEQTTRAIKSFLANSGSSASGSSSDASTDSPLAQVTSSPQARLIHGAPDSTQYRVPPRQHPQHVEDNRPRSMSMTMGKTWLLKFKKK